MLGHDLDDSAFAPNRTAIDLRVQTRRAGCPPHEVRISARLSGAQATDHASGIAATLAAVIADAGLEDPRRLTLQRAAADAHEARAVDDFVPLASVLRRVS